MLLLNKRPRLFGVFITLIGMIPDQAKESGRNNKPVTGLKQDIADFGLLHYSLNSRVVTIIDLIYKVVTETTQLKYKSTWYLWIVQEQHIAMF